MNSFGSFSVAGKHPLSVCLPVSSPVVDGKLAVQLYLVDSFHHHAVSKTVRDSEIDRTSIARGARVQLWFRKNGTPATNKQVISISQVLNETSFAGRPVFSLDGMITAINCRRFFRSVLLPAKRPRHFRCRAGQGHTAAQSTWEHRIRPSISYCHRLHSPRI